MTRGKRLLSLLLSVLMLCTLLPPRASAAPTLYFTAVNDRMCDLNDETMPFWQNGLLYVAGATVDGPDDLGIRYSYNQEKSVAILYKGQRVLYCDLTAGTMENNRTGEQYTGSPIVRSGMVFFPITALAKMFDLKYSSTKIAYGYLLRIRDDNAVLSDEYFIDAATDPIQKRYAQYERAHAAAESEQPETPPPVDTPTRRDDLTVYLLLPAAEEAALTQLLSTLENYQSHATLLLTPELLESAGDGVRRAAATGNAVALWHAASLRTRLVYLESADRTLRTAVAEAGYCPITINTSDFTRSGTHWADTALKWAGRSTSVRLYLGAESGVSSALGTALSRLRAENCTIAALNEVTA